MKISNLYKVGARDNNRLNDVEDYLEKEIIEIVEKKKFDDYSSPYEENNRGLNNHRNNSRGYIPLRDREQPRHNQPNNNFGGREEYLPFNKEEIRPVIRETINAGKIENLIIETIMPHIEDWLDDNLERITQRVVKRYIANQSSVNEKSERNEEDLYESRHSRKSSPRYDRR